MKTAGEIAEWFTGTIMYKSGVAFSASDVSAKTGADHKLCSYAVQHMVDRNIAVPTTNDSHGHPRYIKFAAGKKLIVKKWRKQNVGEIIYYKGMHHLGNGEAGWRGAL